MNTNLNSRSLKSRGFTRRTIFFTLAAFALFAVTAVTAFMGAPLPGSINTTDSGCGSVNINSFPNKSAVYLNGGPQNENAGNGLPDGSYSVRVTEPDGTELGSSTAGPLGDTPVHVTNGHFDQCYRLIDIVSPTGGAPNPGYNDTTNHGDEYKFGYATN
jgi:hypothetical protein